MDKITVVCHKDHVVGYEDYRDQCLLCVVEDLMREIGRLTAVCKEKEWVGLDGEIPGLGLVTEEFYNGMLVAEDILRKKNGG